MNRCLRLAGLLLFAVSAAWANAQTTATIMPSSPRYMEPVFVRITPVAASGLNIYGAQVSMDGNTLTVKYQYLIEIGPSPYDVMLGRLPAGNYTVKVMRSDTVESTAQFTVGAPEGSTSFPGNIPAVNYTDMWWNPSESGWGMSIHQGPTNQLFAVWFIYDVSGKPMWYTLEPGSWTQTNVFSVFSGPVYRTTGPYYGAPFDSTQVRATQAGTATLSFSDASHAQFRYTIDGVTGVKNIEREPIE